MAAEYPGAVKTWTPVADTTDDVMAEDINTGYDEITAVETDLKEAVRVGGMIYAYRNIGGGL